MLMTANQDIETQIYGMVLILYNVGTKQKQRMQTLDRNTVWKNGIMVSTLPIQYKSIHLCYDNMAMKHIVDLAITVSGTHIRSRIRGHFGM